MHEIFNSNRLIHHRYRAVGNFDRMAEVIEYLTNQLTDRVQDIDRRFERAMQYGSWHNAVADQLIKTGQINRMIAGDVVPDMLPDKDKIPGILHPLGLCPIGGASVDLIVSPMVLHLVTDLPGVLTQINWALQPDGVFIGMMAGGMTLIELSESLMMAEEQITGGVAQRIHPRIGLADLSGLLQRAKFALPVADAERLTLKYNDLGRLITDLRSLGMTNAMTENHPLRRDVWQRTKDIYRERFGDSDGRLPVTVDILYAIGWRPDKSQPQPLKPGSADKRLADALNVDERPAGDTTSPH
jgi:SAM-dependent methyltransferase